VLDGIIGPVVTAPALHAQEIAALVEVLGEELAAGGSALAQHLALEQRPRRRRHRRRNADFLGAGGAGENDQRDERESVFHGFAISDVVNYKGGLARVRRTGSAMAACKRDVVAGG